MAKKLPAFLQPKGKRPPEGSPAEEAMESPAEEAAEQKAKKKKKASGSDLVAP